MSDDAELIRDIYGARMDRSGAVIRAPLGTQPPPPPPPPRLIVIGKAREREEGGLQSAD